MMTLNEIEMLDACCDLVYVAVGTATTFELPFDDAFLEVHRSNMTKSTAREANSDDKAIGDRVTGKGDEFEAPDLLSVIQAARAEGPSEDDLDNELENEELEDDDDDLDEELEDDEDEDEDEDENEDDGIHTS